MADNLADQAASLLYGEEPVTSNSPSDLTPDPGPLAVPDLGPQVQQASDLLYGGQDPAPGEAGARLDQLKALEVRDHGIDTDELQTDLQKLALNPFKNGADTVAGYVQQLAPHFPGVDRLGEYPWSDEIQKNAANNFYTFLSKGGLLDTQGPGVEQAKQRLKNAFYGLEVLKATPLLGQARRKLSSSVLLGLAEDQVTRGFDQARTEGRVLPENEIKATLLSLAKQWTPEELDETYRQMLFLGQRTAKNEFEAEVFRSYNAGNVLQRELSSTGVRYEQAQLRKVKDLPQSARMPVRMRVALMREILGENAEAQVINTFQARKTDYLWSQLGIAKDPDGTPRQVSAEALAPTDTLSVLAHQRSLDPDPSIRPSVEAQRDIIAIGQRLGPQARRAFEQQVMEKSVLHYAQQLDRAIAMPPEVEAGLTPFEKEKAGAFSLAMKTALDEVGTVFMGLPTQLVADIDNNLGRNPAINSLAQSTVYGATGDKAVAESTKSIVGAVHTLFMQTLDRGSLAAIFENGKFTPSAIQNHPIFANSTPAEWRGLIQATNRPLEVYEKEYGKGLEAQNERMQRLNKTILEGGQVNPVTFLKDLVLTSAHMAWQGLIEPAYMIADDPTVAAGLVLGGVAAARTAGPMHRAWGETFDRFASASRLKSQLLMLAERAPESAVMFRDAIQRTLVNAAEKGSPARVLSNLESAAAVAETAVKSFTRAGELSQPSQWAGVMRQAFPEIESELGLAGFTMGSNQVPRSAIRRLQDLWTSVTGRPIGVDKTLTAGLESRGFEMAADGLRAVLNDQAAGGILDKNIRNFVEVNGGAPSNLELPALMPKPFANLAGLVMAGEKVALNDPILVRAFQGLAKWKRPDMLKALADTAGETLRSYTDAAVDLHRSYVNWGIKRARNEVLLDTAMTKIRNRIESYDASIQSLDMIAKSGARLSPGTLERIEASRAVRFEASTAQRLKLQRLADTKKRMYEHSSREPWQVPKEMELWSEIDQDTLGMILDAHPQLFDGFTKETLFNMKIVRPTRGQLQDAQLGVRHHKGKLQELDAQIEKANRNPLQADEVIRKWDERLVELTREKAESAKQGRDPDPLLDDERLVLRKRRNLRAQQLRSGELTPSDLDNLKAHRDNTVNDYQRALANLSRVQKGNIEFLPSREGGQMFRRLIDHDGLSQPGLAGVSRAEEMLRAAKAGQLLEQTGNPFGVRSLPVYRLGQYTEGVFKTYQNLLTAKGGKLEDLARVFNNFSLKERAVYGRAAREGTPVGDLLDRHPKLKKILAPERVDRLNSFFKEEAQMFSDYFSALSDTGQVPEKLLAEWRRDVYTPRLYGAFERPKMLEGKARQAAEAFGGVAGEGAEGPVSLRAKEEGLRFKRDLNGYRVRIDQPQTVIDRVFDTPERARAFLVEKYGEGILSKTQRSGAFVSGKTPFGDSFTVGDPIGKELAQVLDPVVGHSAEARLTRLKQGFKDIFVHALQDSLNLYGGYVIDDAQLSELFLQGKNAMAEQFLPIPNNKRAYGNLAGKKVHRTLIAEMNRASMTFDQLTAVMDGLREGMMATMGQLDKDLLPRTVGAIGRAFNVAADVSRASLITYSLRAWIGNPIFNMLSDTISGSGVFSTKNVDTLMWAMREAKPGKLAITRDPIYTEAREHGIITGFFGQRFGDFKKMQLEMLGLEPKNAQKLDALQARRESLVRRAHEARVNGEDAGRIALMEKDLAAVNAAQDQASIGMVKGMFKKLAGFFYQSQDVFGRNVSQAADKIRAWYNWQDEWFKLAQYKNFRKTMPPEMAARSVKLFSQNYAEIPWQLHTIPDALKSMVTSFPYEAGRIAVNAMLHRPAAFLSVLSAIPAFNFFQMAQAGVDWNRLGAVLDARGAKDGVSATGKFMTSMMLFNPINGDLESEIDIHNMLPFTDLVMGHGILDQVYDDVFPPEKRGAMASAAGMGVGYVSNFVGNHPIYNLLGFAMTGYDPTTGKKLVDDNTDPITRAKIGLKIMGQIFVPPQLPGGRDYGAFIDAREAPIRPRTGLPYLQQQPATAVIRGLTGVGIKGRLSDQIGNALGIGRGRSGPLVGDDNIISNILYKTITADPTKEPGDMLPTYGRKHEMMTLLYRTIDESFTPEERAKATAELDKFLKTEAEIDLGAVKGKTSPTERQVELIKSLIGRQGNENYFSKLPVDLQAAALVQMDDARVNDRKLRDFVDTMMWTSTGRLQKEDDPELVQRAVEYLSQGLAKNPHSSRRLADLREHLVGFVLPISQVKRAVEPIKTQAHELKAQALKEARRQ